MNNKISYWDLSQQKDFYGIYKKADEEYAETKSESSLRYKAGALLHLKKYQDVLDNATELIKISNGRTDTEYIWAGIANWFLGNYADAVEILKKGLKTKYTDAAGGVEIPALLYYIAVRSNDKKLEKEAIALLKKRCKSKVSLNYPGFIAGYILDRIDDNELLNSYASFKELKRRILCKAYFYIAVRNLKNGDEEMFYENLKKCIENESYLEYEYFIAIGELDKQTCNE
ncbi:hypothetical protein [Clostridium sp. DL-VIII]|uniref:hypothetical protein n=1 Tax=Clostridium sp. DL-VIII TaxID=641107 RepID=UPI0002FD595F|nr:hypothetical protein [Clostridium sp. DL-VIII]